MAKEWFQQNDVEFSEKDVSVDAEARDALVRESGQMGVPVIKVNSDIVVGFDKNRLASLLGKNSEG